MATVTLRQIKGSALTNTEVDANLTSINAETVDNSTAYNLRPSLDVDLVGSKTVSPLMGFSRASTATYYDVNGVLRTAGVNEPRFNHDPVTGELKGLLIEDSRTNLLTYSEQFDNSVWIKNTILPFGSGSTSDIQIAPDGTLTSDKIVPDTSPGNSHWIYTTKSATQSISYVFSVFVKASGFNYVKLLHADTMGNGYAFFNLIDGLVGTTVNCSASILNVGNNWYRCSVIRTTTANNVWSYISPANGSTNAVGDSNYSGDGTSGIYIWGAQLEAGSTPTSYIPTTSTPVTRAADTLTINKSSNWFNSVNGTLALSHDALSGQPVISEGTNTLVTSLGSGTVNVDYSNSQLSVVTQTGQTANTQGVFNFDSDLYIMGNSATKANAHVRYLKFYPNNVIGSTPAGSGFILDDGYALMQEDGSVIFQE